MSTTSSSLICVSTSPNKLRARWLRLLPIRRNRNHHPCHLDRYPHLNRKYKPPPAHHQTSRLRAHRDPQQQSHPSLNGPAHHRRRLRKSLRETHDVVDIDPGEAPVELRSWSLEQGPFRISGVTGRARAERPASTPRSKQVSNLRCEQRGCGGLNARPAPTRGDASVTGLSPTCALRAHTRFAACATSPTE